MQHHHLLLQKISIKRSAAAALLFHCASIDFAPFDTFFSAGKCLFFNPHRKPWEKLSHAQAIKTTRNARKLQYTSRQLFYISDFLVETHLGKGNVSDFQGG